MRIGERASGRVLWVFPAMIVLLALGVGYIEARKAYWDRKVMELCQKDGGVKIFKPVVLSDADYARLPFAPLDARYVYSSNTEYLVRDGLEVKKYVTRVLDRSSATILSHRVAFSRIGGDLVAVDEPSSFSCPRVKESLFDKTFVRQRAGG